MDFMTPLCVGVRHDLHVASDPAVASLWRVLHRYEEQAHSGMTYRESGGSRRMSKPDYELQGVTANRRILG
jgi:hypothetical protein